MTVSPNPPPAPPSTVRRVWRWPWLQVLVYLLALWVVWRLLVHLHPLVLSVAVAYLIAHLANPCWCAWKRAACRARWGLRCWWRRCWPCCQACCP
ncbi:hypothetical protein [Deinococcus multiflagellatus]|uniref:Uncharacterized protein n=1 Tax=Deinococcus multiflagellatus TaxID=1656887 RepID=A0ABW1ZJ35_9DEIO